MLNYEHLENRFTDELQKFDRNDLLEWLEFERNSVNLEKLLNGEDVLIKREVKDFFKINDDREEVSSDIIDNNYASAA